jgi:purine-binding chemotaxis protein CheW
MTTARSQLDWDSVRQRLARHQAEAADSGPADRDRRADVFRRRARDLARRGRHERAKASRVPVLVFRVGTERFGVPLADLKQVFPRASITQIPGKSKLLLGVANLNGAIRSVVDLNALLHSCTTHSEAGYIVLVRAAERSLALWIESLEGVSEIDLAALVAVDEVASKASGKLMRGITESRIILLDTAAVINHVQEQLSGSEP